MVVRLRFSLMGPRHARVFRMVATESHARRDARPIETLAIYDPQLKTGETHKTVRWSAERIKYWLRVGAEPSRSVVKLLTMVRPPSMSLELR
jgi:small subunit ribosomal protein S16